jgi:lipoprotein-anchoring transpeptidase ErfK/SrfK
MWASRAEGLSGRAGRICGRLAFALVFGLFATSSTASAQVAVVQPTQTLAALLSTHEAFSKPSRSSTPLLLVQAERPLTGERTVLPVVGATKDWLHVRLPGRPNGRTGWIVRYKTVASTTRWHVVVNTTARELIVYRSGRPVRTVKAVVGKPSTPSPGGEFFVEEAIELRASDVGAPFALALSARSEVLQEFDGGPGQIAIHGLSNVGGVPGTAVSHGCVRIDNATMRWLVLRIGPGVPVTITR